MPLFYLQIKVEAGSGLWYTIVATQSDRNLPLRENTLVKGVFSFAHTVTGEIVSQQ